MNDKVVSLVVPVEWMHRDSVRLSEVAQYTSTRLPAWSVMLTRKAFSALPKAHVNAPPCVTLDLAMDLLRADWISQACGLSPSTALRLVRAGFVTLQVEYPPEFEQEAAAVA